jgi:uncharacterized protein
MQCPVCRVDLVMTERQNIEIDYCPRCRGVWLDRGELDKIIERSVAQEAPPAQAVGPSAPPADPRYYGKHGYGHRGQDYRRKSWLHELFD